ncbi:MAG: branched-chain amino acid ABC transporter permease [Nitrososphaerales archaeon]
MSGVTYGIIISLLAVGLSLIYGIMGTVNTSHGVFYMVGGALAFASSNLLKLPATVSIVLSVLGVFALGMAAMIIFIPRRMWVTSESSEQSTVMIMLAALAIVIQQIVSVLYGGSTFVVRSLLQGSIRLPGDVYVTNNVLLAVIITLAVYATLYLFLRNTMLGIGMRAYAQDKESAESLGINGRTISLIAFATGVAMAAIAGCLLAAIYSINSGTGWDQLITAFVIVTFGGIGSIMGSLLGGLIYGIIYSVMQYFYPDISFVLVLLVIYVVIIIRPTGLLGQVVERG